MSISWTKEVAREQCEEGLDPDGSQGPPGPAAFGPSNGIRVNTEVLDRASRAAADVHRRPGTDGHHHHADDATSEAAGSLEQEEFKLGPTLLRTGWSVMTSGPACTPDTSARRWEPTRSS
ncbi:hypothetical protein FHX42_004066 [Saccharopolyspora lacisalsi]|uniref:Uncharacterized protein n=1 Tax=Halosaccharopolyspora lacisalsi TaxID=1000566 RepID=A0A839E4M7_9PSEU|nr:hypothetical protein [Halosaccharopolyspora lacisalsi]